MSRRPGGSRLLDRRVADLQPCGAMATEERRIDADGRAMGKALVIVESPAKARTIAGLLGPDFIVESSIGHIRDLPRGADEVPGRLQG
jgi:hypothetical protein